MPKFIVLPINNFIFRFKVIIITIMFPRCAIERYENPDDERGGGVSSPDDIGARKKAVALGWDEIEF